MNPLAAPCPQTSQFHAELVPWIAGCRSCSFTISHSLSLAVRSRSWDEFWNAVRFKSGVFKSNNADVIVNFSAAVAPEKA